MALYLVRHTQKQKPPFDANKLSYQRYTKRIGLTEKGVNTATVIGRYLSDVTTGALIIASDYVRAQQTATIIAEKCGVKLTLDERLGERILCDGPFDSSQIEAMNMQSLTEWSWSAPGGESMYDTASRLKAVIDQTNNSADTVIVSHSRAIQAFIGTYIEDTQADKFRSADSGFIIKYGDIVRIDDDRLEIINT